MRKKVSIVAGVILLIGAIGYIRVDLIALGRDLVPEMRIMEREKYESMRKSAEINEGRKQAIKDYCVKFGKISPANMTSTLWKSKGTHQKPRIYYTDTAKIVYCETPKCGTSQWRDMMLILDGRLASQAADGSDRVFRMAWNNNFMWNKFNVLKPEGAANITKRLQTYSKIMGVREPMERLVSAYRDKLEGGKNAVYAATSRNIHKRMNPKSKGGLATFEDFIDSILATKSSMGLDPHWKPYSDLCDPCNINYDYIAKLETINDDVTYITEKVGIAREILFNRTVDDSLQKKRMALARDYFNKISQAKRDAVFKYYKEQYDMFGYEYPSFITGIDVKESRSP